jgi:hypothetical protein
MTPENSSTPVLLFGASNLTLGWRQLVSQLQQNLPGSLNLHICAGMGRSYIKPTRFTFRSLPSIADCGLWNQLPQSLTPAKVLITDVGNDIVYGFQPAQIVAAVENCIRRIRTWQPQAHIAMTLPPLAALNQLSKLRFQITRSMLFPGCKLQLPQALQLAEELATLLQQLGTSCGIPLLSPPSDWYGFDPIHLRKSFRTVAFGRMFAAWDTHNPNKHTNCTSDPPSPISSPPAPRPAERRVFGNPWITPQPVFRSQALEVSAW